MSAPIILTVQFDERSEGLFQDLRRRHFPTELNRVGAHLTLFHSLPGDHEDEIIREIARVAKSAAPFKAKVAGPMKLGRGVALRIESRQLEDVRRQLAARFDEWLIRQDKERFRPHVTVQNKVATHVANALFDHLAATLPEFEATVEGIQLWRYDDGRWAPIGAVPFQGPLA